ncbi:hypothetical protein CspeluHIS016_0800340 [Cutaneotrichosporon spelunceum]|uniref:DUF1996 domain-containing protein n=1 Tax=Cutaneotrichosporon spelunceum TaxID=1672016 RepID=A0AAD3TYV3_9TREE|nr:hypothetical protein CspeluHIS016_0800340 [Cutaneotrichosporon spelunceum]
MLFTIASAALAALTLVTPVDAGQFVIPAATLAVARLDPIVNPGTIGGHAHSLLGASNIRDVLNTPEEQLRAGCTSAKVQLDKSSYWVPTIYYIRKDGTYEGMAHSTRVYYNVDPSFTPFPPGMRIVTGDAMSRNQLQENVRGIKMDFAALGRQDWGIFLPNTTAYPTFPGAPRAGIHFPSCGWANQSLDSHDHFSHLTWPISTGGNRVWQEPQSGTCPESHPIRYPGLFMETNYYPTDEQIAEWGTRSNHFILSNGDLLGTSYHADFVNGWPTDVLASAIQNCGQSGEDLASCPAFAGADLADTTRFNCRLQGMVPAEQNGYQEPLQYLPGCNPEWPESAGDKKPTSCPWRKPDPGFTPPNAYYSESILEMTLPLAIEMDPQAEANWTSYTKAPGKLAKISVWGSDQGWGRFFKFLSKVPVMIGTAQDVMDNLNMDTAVFKHCKVEGMQDMSSFTSDTPASVVGKDRWRVLQVPSDTPTYLAIGGPLKTDSVTAPTGASDVDAANNVANNTAAAAPTASAPSDASGASSAAATPTDQAPSAASDVSSGASTPLASPSPSGPANKPVEIPGGGNNLLAHNDEAGPSTASAASTPEVSGSSRPGSKVSGGRKKCTRRRRRRRGSRL